MFPSVRNVICALQHVDSFDTYPTGHNPSLYTLPQNFQFIDRVRKTFFQEEESLNIFDWFCQYRIVESMYDREHADTLPNMPYTREKWEQVLKAAEAADIKGVEGDYLLDRLDAWFLEAYSLHGKCEVVPGDVVLDCGAFTGNTTLYLSQKAGPGGHVYAFEPVTTIFDQLKKNMSNVENVSVINGAISDKKGVVTFSDTGPSSHQTCNGTVKAYAFSIDEFCRTSNVDKVDFIKMDIEGAEEDALRGAEGTIQKHRPKLAISAYHKDTDLINIPVLINKIRPGYQYILRHTSNTKWGTVLYCF